MKPRPDIQQHCIPVLVWFFRGRTPRKNQTRTGMCCPAGGFRSAKNIPLPQIVIFREKPKWERYKSMAVFTLLVLLWGIPRAALAEKVTILLEVPFEVQNAVGLLLNQDGLTTTYETEVTTLRAPYIAVSFVIPDGLDDPTTLVTALVRSANGEYHVGELRPSWATQFDNPLPVCQEELPAPAVISGQLGMLSSLVEVRLAREKIAREKFAVRLAQFSSERMATLEKGFGLTPEAGTTIEKVVDPFTLVNRILRVLSAVNTYAVFQGKRKVH